MKKLLKYDLKSIFKIWWIGAVATLLLSAVGAFCIRILDSERTIPEAVTFLSGILLFFAILGIVAFSVLITVLVFIRFYRNFFTDEGYLTFTLPVKRSDLINSKLIAAMISMVLGFLVLVSDVFILLAFGSGDWSALKELFQEAWKHLFVMPWEQIGIYFPIYVLEFLVAIVLATFFGILLLYCCITFGAVVTKKAKVVTAIAVYYVASGIVSYATQIFFFFGVPGLEHWFAAVIGNPFVNTVFLLFLLCVIFFIAIACAILYALLYWMLDRKLNLA